MDLIKKIFVALTIILLAWTVYVQFTGSVEEQPAQLKSLTYLKVDNDKIDLYAKDKLLFSAMSPTEGNNKPDIFK